MVQRRIGMNSAREGSLSADRLSDCLTCELLQSPNARTNLRDRIAEDENQNKLSSYTDSSFPEWLSFAGVFEG